VGLAADHPVPGEDVEVPGRGGAAGSQGDDTERGGAVQDVDLDGPAADLLGDALAAGVVAVGRGDASIAPSVLM
jgi:hypothetical protein